ncbi:ribbon-helix-helix domain-containing protein [Mariniphaga sediminis]|jgi:predicted transcriptional regulator|uniref:Ribbon-helix-helix domain-containing protein n=1 Tax=Mariniphaga sediminis TaxID=1628158 RepID=A0A399CWK5_9BACT|nr:ribbon-helix-helix domain-containing protein [Mariniphaga sediminis]RIH62791.1 ribbon-helix-helix domain-containing protein [Mariniphaga sediminis]
MSVFTSTLPDELLQKLNEMAAKMAMPKNKIIEKALRIYLDQLTRAEYIKSYRQAGQDTEIMQIAEEGMEDYLKQLGE